MSKIKVNILPVEPDETTEVPVFLLQGDSIYQIYKDLNDEYSLLSLDNGHAQDGPHFKTIQECIDFLPLAQVVDVEINVFKKS